MKPQAYPASLREAEAGEKRILGASQDLEHRRCERCTDPVRIGKYLHFLRIHEIKNLVTCDHVDLHAKHTILFFAVIPLR